MNKLFILSPAIILALSLVPAMLGCAPASAVDHNSRGMELYFEEKYEKAIAEFTKAIKLDPDYADAYSNRGGAYAAIEQYDLAIADYNKAIELDPEDADAYMYRGWAYTDIGQYDLAIADYNKAIELDPEDADAYYWRGAAYADTGQYDLAIADYNKAIELDPNDAYFWNNKGVALEELGRYEEAMECYNNALQLGSSVAESNKERLIARGIPDKGGTLSTGSPNRESFESLTVAASTIYVLQKLEGEGFDVTMSVQYGLPPYRWRLLYTSGVADNVVLSPADEAGEILHVSGTAAYINDPTTESRLGWVMFEVEDSSQPTKWGKGGFSIHVYRADQEKIAEEVAKAWVQSNLPDVASILREAGLAGTGVYGDSSVACSKPIRLGPTVYQVTARLTGYINVQIEEFRYAVEFSADYILTIDTKEKRVIEVQYGEVRVG